MQHIDLDAVLAVQAACYPVSMQEPGSVLSGRLSAAPQSCVVACDEEGVCGYLFAYPSRLGAVTDLGAPFLVATAPDTLYLHDLSVAPRAHGRGWARALVGHLLGLGIERGLVHAALVSVQDSMRFWRGFGFQPAPSKGALDTYPHDALYMKRWLR